MSYEPIVYPADATRPKGEAMWPDILRLFEERVGVTLNLDDLMELTGNYYERGQISSCVYNMISSNKRRIAGKIQVLDRGVYRMPTEAQLAAGIPPRARKPRASRAQGRAQADIARIAELEALLADADGGYHHLKALNDKLTNALDTAMKLAARRATDLQAIAQYALDSAKEPTP